ncbi:hypothetical protein L1887_31989 [Cichorium endivia]|nr:hypothetical protein L1887_31989 [Cichorium endivia]
MTYLGHIITLITQPFQRCFLCGFVSCKSFTPPDLLPCELFTPSANTQERGTVNANLTDQGSQSDFSLRICFR